MDAYLACFEEMNLMGGLHANSSLQDLLAEDSSNPNLNSTYAVAKSLSEWEVIIPLYFIIFFMCIFANGMVIATLIFNRRTRTAIDALMLNLAVSDSLVGALCMPITLIGQIYHRFILAPIMCKIIPFLQAVSVTVAMWTLVVISLERYFAICHALKSRRWQTKKHAHRTIILLWIMSCVLNGPIYVTSTLKHLRTNADMCREQWSHRLMEQMYNIIMNIGILIFPILIMTFSHRAITKKLWRSIKLEKKHKIIWQKNAEKIRIEIAEPREPLETVDAEICSDQQQLFKSEEDTTKESQKPAPDTDVQKKLDFQHALRSTHMQRSINEKKKIIRMLLVIQATFMVCWTPLLTINSIYLFRPEILSDYVGKKEVMWLQLLAYCSTCCNPAIYAGMSSNFQKAFLELFCGKKHNVRAMVPTPSAFTPTQRVAARVIYGSHSGLSGRPNRRRRMSI